MGYSGVVTWQQAWCHIGGWEVRGMELRAQGGVEGTSGVVDDDNGHLPSSLCIAVVVVRRRRAAGTHPGSFERLARAGVVQRLLVIWGRARQQLR